MAMTKENLKKLVLNSNLTQKHKKVFLEIVEASNPTLPTDLTKNYTLQSVAGVPTWVVNA